MSEKLRRIAVVNPDRCRPNKCSLECKRGCPVNRSGKMCIDVKETSKIANISEELCIGCGICIKKCPFNAIQIINLPTDLDKDVVHRYSKNSFKLHRLPTPRPNQVVGLVGVNGVGKSTTLRILSNQTKPNLGKYSDPPEWKEILKYFKGSELQNLFVRILEDNLKSVTKPQFVDVIRKVKSGKVSDLLRKQDERGVFDQMVSALSLENVLDKEIAGISGGELQRIAIAITCSKKADIYLFDEPSSYLDVKQRVAAATVIRSLLDDSNGAYVVVVEHDLSILDYLSDYVCILYGLPSVYGVVTLPFGVREGINAFLDGVVPTENMRFRDESLSFKMTENTTEHIEEQNGYTKTRRYSNMQKTFFDKGGEKTFELLVEEGSFRESEIVVLLGENGMGKSTFIKLLSGSTKPNKGKLKIEDLSISYKPQNISSIRGAEHILVKDLMMNKLGGLMHSSTFKMEIIRPFKIEDIMEQEIGNLSGGELQRVLITLCLGKSADLYLIDEPSAYLDSEQRMVVAKAIKKHIVNMNKSAFIVEHDLMMATYMADRIVVYEGDPGKSAIARTPTGVVDGMNMFLKSLQITFRRDPINFRLRINKKDSIKDKEQKSSGNYFFIE